MCLVSRRSCSEEDDAGPDAAAPVGGGGADDGSMSGNPLAGAGDHSAVHFLLFFVEFFCRSKCFDFSANYGRDDLRLTHSSLLTELHDSQIFTNRTLTNRTFAERLWPI